MTFTIAIDGSAGSGKGVLATGISDRFNLAYFDTGLLYRGLSYIVLEEFGENFKKNDVINIAKLFKVN
ncbi:MAG: cytidylate kinase, partial [Alphaproteobacteria bacterium]|nr:cytidylate kinase [Alphaproteobacteria bacterium]